MMGECHYHLGNYAEAVALYEQSLSLYLEHQSDGWQSRLEADSVTVQPNNTAVAQARISWGASRRGRGVARLPSTFKMLFGRLDAVRAFQEGGVFQRPEYKQVNVTEIMRCVALCLHRRRVIKGPIAKYDPLSTALVRGFNSGPVGDGSVLGSYNGVCLGIAYATIEDWKRAGTTLNRSLSLNGGLDHPLTPVGLLEAAYIGLAIDNDRVAAELSLESSYSAAVFDQYDIVAEALSLGTMVHLKTAKSPYPPLQNVAGWAKVNNADQLQATAIIRLAECYSESGNITASENTLARTNSVINRRNSLANCTINARLKYVTALNQFLSADFAAGQKSLSAALAHFSSGSLWIYRLKLASNLAASGNASARQLDQLYGALLRDPTDADWKIDPFETIAYLASPHVKLMEQWFEIVVARRNFKKAFEIAELARRHRFFATLPMGGRLMAFRWVIHAPKSALNENALAQRANFLNRNSAYRKSIERTNEIQELLKQIPLDSEPKSDDANEQAELLDELNKISTAQENVLASNALRREPSELVFPPSFTETQIRDALRPDQLALVTFATASGYHFFIVDQSSVQYTGFSKARDLQRTVAKWLKQLGATGVTVDQKLISDTQWKTTGKEISDFLFAKIVAEQWDATKELIVVPDGALWYLPFEALMMGEDDDQSLLSEMVNIRYSPTVSLAFGGQRPITPADNLVTIASRLSPKTEIELTNSQYDQWIDPLPESIKFESFRQSSNLLGNQIDQLLDWSYIKATRGRALATVPISIEKSNADDGSLNAWMTLPWGAPQHLILPGYQSPGITLKGRPPGIDMFLTTTGLMAAGSRSILISRWNTAGKTAFQLTGNYASSHQTDGIGKAIAESRKLVRETDLDFANEPRYRSKGDEPAIKTEHPFFWASHMLLAIPDETEPKIRPYKKQSGGSTGLAPAADNGLPKVPQANEKVEADEPEKKTEDAETEKNAETIEVVDEPKAAEPLEATEETETADE
jgi:CHAT domain-containing protein